MDTFTGQIFRKQGCQPRALEARNRGGEGWLVNWNHERMSKENNGGVIIPDRGYNAVEIAKVLDKSPRWVRERLMNTGEIPVNAINMTMGWAIIAWIERDMQSKERKGETDA
jgi:hypothetical protein